MIVFARTPSSANRQIGTRAVSFWFAADEELNSLQEYIAKMAAPLCRPTELAGPRVFSFYRCPVHGRARAEKLSFA